MRNESVCVIGGGIVGLTTAVLAQEAGARVTLVADKFFRETTSDGAAGIFRPSSSFNILTPQLTSDLLTFSYRYYETLLNEPDAGVKLISGYQLSNIDPANVRNRFLEGIVPDYRPATVDELSQFPTRWKWGSYYTTLLIECRFYLPWLAKRFKERGGKIVRGRVSSFSDVNSHGQFALVFNCTGFGARDLCNDQTVVPLSGQVYKVDAPSCDKFLYGEADTYVIPGFLATIGGSRHFESYRTRPCPHDGAAIWSRARTLLPTLQTSQIRRQWVGVRPYRTGGVRIQAEIINGMKIIHNYGHGGYGITSAPGTARHAVQLAETLISTNKL